MKVADMHCDTILAILRGKEQGKEISLCKNNLNVDLERMKKGDYLIQNFAFFWIWRIRCLQEVHSVMQ